MFNVVALRGRLSRPAELRVLPTGSTLVGLEVTTRRGDDVKADTVPVVWHDAPAAAQSFDEGDATQSRTEVVASAVIPVRSAKRAEAALRQAASVIDEALPVRASK
jgi:hypothetical protein